MHGIELNTLFCDSNNIKLKRVERKWYTPQLCFGVTCYYIYRSSKRRSYHRSSIIVNVRIRFGGTYTKIGTM